MSPVSPDGSNNVYNIHIVDVKKKEMRKTTEKTMNYVSEVWSTNFPGVNHELERLFYFFVIRCFHCTMRLDCIFFISFI